VLLAYLRFAGDRSVVSCGQLREEQRSADVLVNLLVASGAGSDERLTQASTAALRLGATSDLSRPALLSLPEIGGTPASWLVAYADEDGDVVIDRLRRNGASLEVAQPGLIRIGTGGAVNRSSIALALGVGEDGSLTLGVAHQRGCLSGANVVLDLFRLRGDGVKLEAELAADAVHVGDLGSEVFPSLAHSPARDAWLVSFRDTLGLRARVVAADGRRHAGAYTLIVRRDGSNDYDVLPLPTATFEATDGFVTFAHVLRPAEESPRAFEAFELSCDP
jgi:hypothetical protein